MNQVTRTRGQFKYNRQQVLYLTGMTQEQYNNFQIDTAKEWVERYYQSIMDTDRLLSTIMFWKWWMYHWSGIDDKMILSVLYDAPKKKRLMFYRQLHQYVFDDTDENQKYLITDFRHMRKEFEKEKKNPSL